MTRTVTVRITTDLHTPLAVFDKARELIGAGPTHHYYAEEGLVSMNIAQGLPVWLQVRHNQQDNSLEQLPAGGTESRTASADGTPEPPGYIDVRLDSSGQAGDVLAWVTRELASWLSYGGGRCAVYDEYRGQWIRLLDPEDLLPIGNPDRGALK